ncbi:sugar ABC transporter substrate-binding protein [Luedemannella helvata]|uniref:Sugar ABC transporter substrate-binding protein n=1 Tax=Luedemannella helvata TaxID=349315 RepID=A0ABN2JXQ0_9ACTN
MGTKLGRKRGLALAVAMATVASLAACGGDSGAQPTGKDADGPLSVLMLASASYDPCSEEIAKAFRAKTGREVKMVHEGYPTFHDKAITALAGGGAYDVIMLAYQWTGEFAAQGLLADLTERAKNDADLDGIFEPVMDLYTNDGKQYAIPFTAQAETLFYRKDLLEAEGFEVPKTWEEYEKIAKHFTNNPKYPGLYGTSIKAASQHIQQAFDNRYWGLGGGPLGQPGSTMDLELTKQAMEQLKRHTLQYSPPGALAATFTEAQRAFQAGNAVMTELMPSTVLALLINETPENKVYNKVGAAVMPGGHGEIGSWAMAVSSKTKRPDAAYEWSKMAANVELDLTCQTQFGKSAVRASTYENPGLRDTFYAAGVRAGLDAGYGIPNGVTASKINNMVMETLSKYMAGQISSSDEAARSIVDKYADLVNQAG